MFTCPAVHGKELTKMKWKVMNTTAVTFIAQLRQNQAVSERYIENYLFCWSGWITRWQGDTEHFNHTEVSPLGKFRIKFKPDSSCPDKSLALLHLQTEAEPRPKGVQTHQRFPSRCWNFEGETLCWKAFFTKALSYCCHQNTLWTQMEMCEHWILL